ncbi:DUF6624 domain-containing protein [Mariniflexile aquimaris]|uniref:DUF6624 domain-containing protein n=1 Tax=Mariniflexile aquimaris TaxID=881009 RepID=A0ABW3BTA8_9FLAO
MKKTALFTIIGLLMINLSFGQENEKYSELINKAWKLYETKEYLKSAEKYSEAFNLSNGKEKSSDRYNAACSWALANIIDSSFVQLFKIVKYDNYSNYNHITTDTDLTNLYPDKRWNEIIELVKVNKEKKEEKYDKTLVSILDTIYKEDQTYRIQIKGIEEKYGRESEEIKRHFKLILEKDSINLIKVKKILDERGWLGTDLIGSQGNSTLFLIIQHSPLDVQEKYLPMIRDAVKKGNARASSLALLEDRVALRKGERQIYGSQIGRDQVTGEYYVSPLIDPDNVDKRRSEVGLGKLTDYVSRYGIIWDIEKYKIQLLELEAKQN